MTRGKNARLTAARAVADERTAKAELRAAEQEVRRLSLLIDARDREIAQLKSAIVDARHERTTPGTYTEADVARIRVEARNAHRRAVTAGFALFRQYDAPVIPKDNVAGLIEAFDVEPTDLFPDLLITRTARRTSMRKVRMLDDLASRGVEI